MRFVNRGFLKAMLFVLAGFGVNQLPHAVAQEATPTTAGDCPVTTPDDNVALVIRFLESTHTVDDGADTSDESAAMEEILADDVIHEAPGAKEGSTADVDAVLIARIECGQIAEFTQVIDSLSLLQQLGIETLPPVATPAA